MHAYVCFCRLPFSSVNMTKGKSQILEIIKRKKPDADHPLLPLPVALLLFCYGQSFFLLLQGYWFFDFSGREIEQSNSTIHKDDIIMLSHDAQKRGRAATNCWASFPFLWNTYPGGRGYCHFTKPWYENKLHNDMNWEEMWNSFMCLKCAPLVSGHHWQVVCVCVFVCDHAHVCVCHLPVLQ